MVDHAGMALEALANGQWEAARVAMLHGAGIRVRDGEPPVAAAPDPDLAALAEVRLSDMHSPIFTAAWAVLVRYGIDRDRLWRSAWRRLARDPMVAVDLAALAVRDAVVEEAVLELLRHAEASAGTVRLAAAVAERLAASGSGATAETRQLLVGIARQAGRDGQRLRYWLALLPVTR